MYIGSISDYTSPISRTVSMMFERAIGSVPDLSWFRENGGGRGELTSRVPNRIPVRRRIIKPPTSDLLRQTKREFLGAKLI